VTLGMSRQPGRVYVVDDDAELCDGVVSCLSDDGYEARGFASGEELLREYPRLAPGVIVADMMMPNMNGLELQRFLRDAGCRWPFILLIGHARRPVLTSAVQAGVLAFLEKPVRETELLAAVMKGQSHLGGHLEIIPDPELVDRLNLLTRREGQVLDFVLHDKLNKQIAAMLGIEETTVKGYRRAMMKKLRVHNLLELVVLAVRAGLYIPPKS
jgi:FixJ family two-component response regulator